ncbi:hypothetical protein AURDEDRAFT_159380 [Auricularia subglabra TFB-10046 SS5]|nr:hypothetical protein AURDEDRAFT_159380 [Auricularia subglabra TFB-10046 SS5]
MPVYEPAHLDLHLQRLLVHMPALENLFLRLYWPLRYIPKPVDVKCVLDALNALLSHAAAPPLVALGIWLSVPPRALVAPDFLPAMSEWPTLTRSPLLCMLDLRLHFMLHDHSASYAPAASWVFLPSLSALEEIRISASDFTTASPANWQNQPSLRRVRIDGRVYFLSRPIVCTYFARALQAVIPSWAKTLTVLQLFDITFDYAVATSVSQFTALRQFDIHPSELDTHDCDAVLNVEDANRALASQRLDGARVDFDPGDPGCPTPRLVIVHDAVPPPFPHFLWMMPHIADRIYALMASCLPSISSLTVLHFGSIDWCAAVPEKHLNDPDNILLKLALICPSLTLLHIGPHRSHDTLHIHPPELWLKIFHHTPCSATQALYQSLAAVCSHARVLVLDRAFLSIRARAPQAFLLQSFIEQMTLLRVHHPFLYTKHLQILCTATDLNPVFAMPRLAFSTLTSLDILACPIPAPLQDCDRALIASSLARIQLLHSFRSLERFALYIFSDHAYAPHGDLDVTHLNAISDLHSLRSLSLRLGGGIALKTHHDLELPPNLRRLRLSTQIMPLVHRSCWHSSALLTQVDIEDERDMRHLERAYYPADGARLLSGALAAAVAAWTSTLLTLRLLGTYLDYPAILCIAQLPLLTRLHFHPSSFDINDYERSLLSAATPQPTKDTGPSPAPHRLPFTGKGPFHAAMMLPTALSDFLQAIKYLLQHLTRLSVLQIGCGARGDWTTTMLPARAVLTQYRHICDALWQFLPPPLALWHLGTWDAAFQPVYLHMPTCPLCASLAAGERSPRCKHLEDQISDEHADNMAVCPTMRSLEMELDPLRSRHR